MCRSLFLALLLPIASAALADSVIWDQSPATWGGVNGFTAFNIQDSQNFTDAVTFDQPHWVTGVDVYTSIDTIGVNDPVVVRVFSDSGGQPGALLAESLESIDFRDGQGAAGPDIVRIGAGLTSPILLQANTTYWIGMSGNQVQLGQDFLLLDPPFADGRAAQMDGATFDFLQGAFGDQAFRLHGRAVPEPSALLAAAMAAIALPWRRRAG